MFLSEQHSLEQVPSLQDHTSHSMGNTTCVTPGRIFCSFQLGTHSPGFPEYDRKVEALWLNTKTSLILPSRCWKILFFSQSDYVHRHIKTTIIGFASLKVCKRSNSAENHARGSWPEEKGNRRAVTPCFCPRQKRLACRNFWEKAGKLLP